MGTKRTSSVELNRETQRREIASIREPVRFAYPFETTRRSQDDLAQLASASGCILMPLDVLSGYAEWPQGGCRQRILIEHNTRLAAYPMAIRYFLRFVSPFAEPSMSTSKGHALKGVGSISRVLGRDVGLTG